MRDRIVLFCVLVAGMAGCASPPPLALRPGQHPGSFTTKVTVDFSLSYLLYQPDGFGEGDRRWPLLVFLHGSGERGRDLDKVAVHGPPRLIAEGRAFPFVVLSPQCPERDDWRTETALAALDVLIDTIAADPRIDPDRIYLTGLSMGGFGTWMLAVRHPDRFAAIAPVCGGGEPARAASIAALPIWAFHGALDDVVPPRRSEEMIEALRAAGAEPRFTLYPDANHDAWTRTYADDELYAWLLAQRRGH